MKNRTSVEALCEAPDEQSRFLELASPEMQFSARLEATGAVGIISQASAALAGLGDAPFERTRPHLVSVATCLSRDAVRNLLVEEARRFQSCPIYNVATHVVDAEAFGGLVAYQDANLRVSLVSLTPVAHRSKSRNPVNDKPRGITIQGNDSVLHVLAAGEITMRWWDAEPFTRESALDNRRLAEPRLQRVGEGDTLALEGGRHGMSIVDIDMPILLVVVTSLRPRASVNAHYIAESGALHSFTAADMKASRIQLLATLLRELDVGGDDALRSLLDYEDHFVRWHVMRELLAMEGSKAIPLLRTMVDDAHPQVRDAAQRTMALIDEGTLCLA